MVFERAGAKTLIAKTRESTPSSESSATPEDLLSDSEKIANLNRRVVDLQAQVAELSSEQKSSAELIKLLAEQNAEVVKAIEVFRIRTRILMSLCALLGVALTIFAYWITIR